jgi:hypothetical protein
MVLADDFPLRWYRNITGWSLRAMAVALWLI